MQLDGTTGQFKSVFDVHVEGGLADGCLVFIPRSTDLDAPIWAKGARPLKNADDWDKSTGMSQHKIAERGRLTVDDADCFVALADLVDNKHKERYPESAGWPPYLLAGDDDGMWMIRHNDGQYCLRDDGSLLRLAMRIGPLFGLYGDQVGYVDGDVVREPIAEWIAAAGFALFASRLAAFLKDGRDAEPLLDDLHFSEAIAFKADGSRFSMWTCSHLIDDGLTPAYAELLERASRESFWLESGHIATTDMGAQVAVHGSTVIDQTDGVSRLIGLDGAGACIACELKTGDGITRHKAQMVADYIDPRFEAAPSADITPRFMMEDERLAEIATALLRGILDNAIGCHSAHVVMTRLTNKYAAVTYNSTLERLWAGFASHLSHGTLRICPYCGRAFIPEPSNMKYCKLDPVKECKARKDEDDKNRKRKVRSLVAEAVKTNCNVGDIIRARDLIYKQPLEGMFEISEIDSALAYLAKSKRGNSLKAAKGGGYFVC